MAQPDLRLVVRRRGGGSAASMAMVTPLGSSRPCGRLSRNSASPFLSRSAVTAITRWPVFLVAISWLTDKAGWA